MTTEEDLKKVIVEHHKFSPHSICIKKEATGQSKGFGFVVLQTLHEAKRLIEMCEKGLILVDGQPLYANLHQTKEE